MLMPGYLEHWPIAHIFSALLLALVAWKLHKTWTKAVGRLSVHLTPELAKRSYNSGGSADTAGAPNIPCRDPATAELICYLPAMTAEEVDIAVDKARGAAQVWRSSSFQQRKVFLTLLLRYIIDHQEDICSIAAKDSGKPMVDAAFGEVMVTCEKLAWLLRQGERYLKPERRSAGSLMFYKSARVEFHPLGVVSGSHRCFKPDKSMLDF